MRGTDVITFSARKGDVLFFGEWFRAMRGVVH